MTQEAPEGATFVIMIEAECQDPQALQHDLTMALELFQENNNVHTFAVRARDLGRTEPPWHEIELGGRRW